MQIQRMISSGAPYSRIQNVSGLLAYLDPDPEHVLAKLGESADRASQL